ncbi:hypothetical protein M408DRAFT_18149 [Serendipita vermifera MAFF 305830]|uniref:Autophagy-related protein 11 n=1 Tax=Serendipita vermifera MAFF 305830 TaxID=933852 RepID=A0A0C3ATG2_SERVB|nr:hypothetical protein M408DRAFT_18149 [Serendipita vermifera MAFF 305830]
MSRKPNTLRPLLSSLTSIDPAAIIMFLSDGQQLREDNIRDLSGAQDQSIFVFNRDYLDLEIEEVMSVLGVQDGEGLLPNDTLQAEDSISSLHTSQVLQDHLQRAQQHQSYISALLQQVHNQHEALQIASSNLDMHVLTLGDAWSALKDSVSAGLESQAKLLESIDYDLDAISQISVHPSFLAVAAAKSGNAGAGSAAGKDHDSEGGLRSKMLGEYVSRAKMKLVVEGCRRTHAGLVTRFRNAQVSMEDLTKGSDEVRASINPDGPLAEASICTKRSFDNLERVSALVSAWGEVEDPSQEDTEGLMNEMQVLDTAMRQEVLLIGRIKNRHTQELLHTLRHISTLQSSIFSLPTVLTGLENDLRMKGGFAHLQRLHGMAFAYGASVIEVVRRREFGRFFMQRAQAMAEIMAKFASSERKRRQVYRGESLSLLPFETQSMDLEAPSLEVSTKGMEDGPYDINREDVEVLLEAMRQIEEETAPQLHNAAGSQTAHPMKETREALEKLVVRMDSLESDFDRLAEKSILSSTRLAYYKRRSINEATAYNEAAEQLQELQGQQEAQEQQFEAERKAFRTRINELDSQNNHLNSQLPQLENEIEHLQALLKQARTNVEQTHSRYEEAQAKNHTYEQDLRQRNSEISKMLNQLEQDEEAQRTLRLEKAEMNDTSKMQAERLETANRTIAGHTERISALEKDVSSMAEENSLLMKREEESKKRIENLEGQLMQARMEGDDAKSALKEAVRERDRLLRDHRVEADGDRAVLEHRFMETRSQLESDRQQLQETQQRFSAMNSQLTSLRSQNSILQSDLSSLREELKRTSHELAISTQAENMAQQTENTLRAELNFANNALVQVESKQERTERILAQVFDVAIAFRNSHARALAQAQVMLKPIAARGASYSGPLGDSTVLVPGGGMEFGSPPRIQAAGSLGLQPSVPDRPSSPTPIDPSDPLAALDTLREFDLDAFAETIAKTGLTIRKWQKQCKEYRDRAKGKISFRNFQKGDLALFLPTRNSVARPWAAFNMSFPHYFLSATGHIADQLKTREWIVARITSIAERVVDSNDPTSNPYGLGNGVKYYMLEVEDWTLNTPNPTNRPKTTRGTSIPAARPGLAQIESWRDSAAISQSPPLASLIPLQPKQSEDPDIVEGITAISSRPRATTASSIGAGPSSLSRLLAQANKEPSPVEPPKLSTPFMTPPSAPKVEISSIPMPSQEESEDQDSLEAEEPPKEAPRNVDNPSQKVISNSPHPITSPLPPIAPSPLMRLSPRNSPKPSPRQRPSTLHIASGSPLASTSNVNVKGSTANRRTDSVRSSMSSTRPSTIFRRPPFALASSPSKAVLTTSSITDLVTSPSGDANSPFRISTEDLEGRIDEEIHETPSPAESATEGMNSVLWGHARRRTTSTITPATAALSQISSILNPFSWGRKRPNSLIFTEDEGSGRRSSLSRVREHTRAASSDVSRDAAGILRKYDAGRE